MKSARTIIREFGVAIALAGSILLPSVALANSGGGDTFKEGVNYIAIKPPLVVNYGGPGRVKYIKAELSLRTEDAHSAQEVSHHMPLIRDTLIMLISSVTDEQMASADGKEKMRVEALAKINEALEKVNAGPEGAHDETKKPAKDEHDKAEKPKGDKAKKDEKSKDHDEDSKKEEHKGPPVSDLLFDNLVVQK
ncbi:MAG: flagellar basal body-associated protein FliL [Moraxellaceae bacterium]|nr:MAG: flagellar basal body-associated protein FliL [Moraxellaceae bacterium]